MKLGNSIHGETHRARQTSHEPVPGLSGLLDPCVENGGDTIEWDSAILAVDSRRVFGLNPKSAMPSESTPQSAASDSRSADGIAVLLETLRGRIRQYVLWHGLALAAIWLCGSFWLALALDYGPVLLGFPELSRGLRALLLLGMTVVLGWILYAWVFRRFRKKLNAGSLALLLERRFPELQDALVTVVQDPPPRDAEISAILPADQAQATRDHQQMLVTTRRHAEQALQNRSLHEVFNFRPLIGALLVAGLLATSVVGWALSRPEAFSTAVNRVYLLDEHQWPRDCHIEMVGVKVKYSEPVEGVPDLNEPRPFQDRQVQVARAAGLSLLVRAAMPGESSSARKLPRVCEFIYRTAAGQRGRLPMSKIGGARSGYQSYALQGDLLERVTDDIRFYVRGDDHTIGPFDILAVNPPVVISTEIRCQYPAYLVDEASSRFTDRSLPYAAGMKLPIGTRAEVYVELDAPVTEAYLIDGEGKVYEQAFWKDAICRVPLGEIREPVQFGLIIRGGPVFLPRPLRIQVGAETDKPPQITSRLPGIGTAVTPQAKIPVVAEIVDQHGVQATWIELQTPLRDSLAVQQTATEGTLTCEIDLRQLRIASQIPADLPTDPPGEIVLTVIAKDHFNLHGGENVGAGTQHPLEVVSEDRLLRILEREEADQRFRLEQVYQEMLDARSYLERARGSRVNLQAGFEPGDEASLDVATANDSQDRDLRQLFLQRCLLQTQKSMQELAGVAFTFDNIRQQLINNRIDAEDRKQRLNQDVCIPLQILVNRSLPAVESRLQDTERVFRQWNDAGARDPPVEIWCSRSTK